jgi:hypothetical protein
VKRKKPPKRGQDPTLPKGRIGQLVSAATSAVALGASRAWLADCELRGGLGAPGASAIVNATATAIELARCTVTGGGGVLGGGSAPPIVGATAANAGLLSIRWNEPPYRRGSLQPGQPWAVHLRGPASAAVLVAASFAPGATAAALTRQPALLPGEVALVLGLVTGTAGHASHVGAVPAVPALVGAGLWLQGAALASWPLEASPWTGAVVRP